MTIIAIDRYQAIINPLRKRLSTNVPISVTIFFIWVAAAIFALPNGAFNRVVQLHEYLLRCRAVYPENNQYQYLRSITLFTVLSQYCIPLSITAYAYIRISLYVWRKLTDPAKSCLTNVAQANEKIIINNQNPNNVNNSNAHNNLSKNNNNFTQPDEYLDQSLPSLPPSQVGNSKRPAFYYHVNVCQLRERSRRKTIKMLAIVVGVFAICWLPLNIFYVVELWSDRIMDSNIFFVCHWFAMSSVCWNSFIYFWLNRHYRQEIRQLAQRTKMPCFHSSIEQLTPEKSNNNFGAIREMKKNSNPKYDVITNGAKEKKIESLTTMAAVNGTPPHNTNNNNNGNIVGYSKNKIVFQRFCNIPFQATSTCDNLSNSYSHTCCHNSCNRCNCSYNSKSNNGSNQGSHKCNGNKNKTNGNNRNIMTKNKSKLYRSNAMRRQSNDMASSSLERWSNRSMNGQNSIGPSSSSHTESHRNSDI